MIKQRTIVLTAASGVFAIGAAWVANNWALGQNDLVTELRKTDTNVVVAMINIPYGQKLEEQHIRIVKMPKSLAPANIYHNKADAIGLVAKTPHLAGDVLREERFAQHLEGSTLAAMIGPNMRAITLRVDDVVGVAGFLLPGNRVDVLATKGKRDKKAVETLLNSIKVLAVDQTTSTDKNEPVIVRAVTLEMSPSQAEDLVKARDEGKIQLALRNPLEKKVIKPKPIVKPKKPVFYAAGPRKITVIRGTNVTVVKR